MKFIVIFIGLVSACFCHPIEFHKDPFRQLEEVWANPNRVEDSLWRLLDPNTGNNEADYNLKVTLTEKKNLLTA